MVASNGEAAKQVTARDHILLYAMQCRVELVLGIGGALDILCLGSIYILECAAFQLSLPGLYV